MKKLLLSLAFMMLSVVAVFADSPLTSTDFYKAYLDIPVVNQASQANGRINENIIKFIGSDRNPVDQRLAVVNALGFGHKQNFTAFSDFLGDKYDVDPSEIMERLSADMLVVLYYMYAMDNYDDMEKVSSASVLIDAMCNEDLPKVSYMLINGILRSELDIKTGVKFLKTVDYQCDAVRFANYDQDMRPEAVHIAWEYMKAYDYPSISISNTSRNPFSIKVNGKYVGTVEGNGEFIYACDKIGYYHIEATQKSGYAFYPTVNNRDIEVNSINEFFTTIGSDN